jgi:hypothetical protein
MKSKIKIVVCFLLAINNVQCQKKEKLNSTVENTNKMKDNIIETVLTKQLKQGTTLTIDEAGAGLPKNKFEIDELEAVSKITDKLLKSNNFKELTNEDFISRIKNIFNRTIDVNSNSIYLYSNFLQKCDRELIMYKNNEIDYVGIFIDKKGKMITDFYYIPELVDYQKEYPTLTKIENIKVTRQSSYDNLGIEIPHWKDVPNLKEIRKRNIETLVARNMYLFNDSKAHFRWLVLNDQYFMRSLVTTFGYYDDKELVKWAVENTESHDDDQYKKSDFKGLSEILWNKKCDNSYLINTNALQIIKEISTPKNYSRIFDVYTILQDLVHSNEEFSFDEIPFKDKAKIVAHILEFGEQFKYDDAYGYNQMFLGKFIYYLDAKKKYINEFELNNYYNLPNLKKWYQLAKAEKDGFANDETLMDDPNFTNYLYRSTTFKTPKK